MKGVVSSGSVCTSRAGLFALKEGGNAIDAMIASQLAAHMRANAHWIWRCWNGQYSI